MDVNELIFFTKLSRTGNVIINIFEYQRKIKNVTFWIMLLWLNEVKNLLFPPIYDGHFIIDDFTHGFESLTIPAKVDS